MRDKGIPPSTFRPPKYPASAALLKRIERLSTAISKRNMNKGSLY